MFNDEEERRREQAAVRLREQQDRLRAAYEDMRTTGKAQDMREQVRGFRMGFSILRY